MNITTITYRRIKNRGNFENEQLEITIDVTGKDPSTEFDSLKKFVEKKLRIKKSKKFKYEMRGHGPVCVCDECM